MNLHVVTAYRYDTREGHSYVVGVFSSPEVAKVASDSEEEFRGGKYTCRTEMYELDIDKISRRKLKKEVAKAQLKAMNGVPCDIVGGAYYELPEGEIVLVLKVYWVTTEWAINCYTNSGMSFDVTQKVTELWKRRSDLRDFPNATNPRLPYEFDLLWDLKYRSCIERELEEHEDEAKIRALMAKHNIKL